METFCSETILIKGFDIQFRPKKKKKIQLQTNSWNISFQNVPAETPDESLAEFLSQYANIEGVPFYVQKDFNGIPYYTDTRVYQVKVLHEHILCYIHDMLGLTLEYRYDN